MNFKRYTKQDVANCFEADMRSSTFERVVENEETVSSQSIYPPLSHHITSHKLID